MIGASGTGSALQVRQTPGNRSRPPALAPIQMLRRKVAVVTGSSSGIGAAIVGELASRGASVVINYPLASPARQGESILESLDAPGMSVQADLSTVEGPKQLVDAAVKRYGRIDILVNNASVAIFKPLELATLDEWDRTVNLNGRGYFLTTQSALPHLSNRHGSSISQGLIVVSRLRLTQYTLEQKGCKTHSPKYGPTNCSQSMAVQSTPLFQVPHGNSCCR
jgi:NAD(P)-dependent dehydrogenase (short-subunit alcohol dehydrogenase family)